MPLSAAHVDASTLVVTAFNVGMMNEKAFNFLKKQEDYVAQLARHVNTWLRGDPAVVGLNEIHPSLVQKLVKKLEERRLDVGHATSDSNSLFWRLSSLFT